MKFEFKSSLFEKRMKYVKLFLKNQIKTKGQKSKVKSQNRTQAKNFHELTVRYFNIDPSEG